MGKPSEWYVAYYHGIMDGISIAAQGDTKIVDEARTEIAKQRHVCYSSIIGPYCVICRRDIRTEDYTPHWSHM